MNDFVSIKDVKGETIQLKRIGNELLCVSAGKPGKRLKIYYISQEKI